MKDRQRFYTTESGVSDDAFARLIEKAIELGNRNAEIKKIVFIGHSLNNTGWLQRQYGDDGVKKIKAGAKLPKSNIIAKFESLKTYTNHSNEIIITLGLNSDEILLLEDNYEVAAILAQPWVENSVDKWAKVTKAINIETNLETETYPLPDCVVIEALKDLTHSINMSTGIMNSSDNDLAKTYLRTLKKYEVTLNENEIEAYLFRILNWTKEHTDQFLDIVNKINNGKTFQGGDKTGLQYFIKKWKDTCKE